MFDQLDLRDAFFRSVFVVHFFAIDEQDHVCVLFNSSAIVTDYSVREPIRWTWNRQIEDLFFAIGRD